jgi:phosphoribosylglycinamide formyltransferase-1
MPDSPAPRLRLGVLASGEGTILQALLDASLTNRLPAEIALVGCNRAGIGALARAHAAGAPSFLADRSVIRTRVERQRLLMGALQDARVDLVVLAGYDEILEPAFVAAFAGRMVNTHPSLLPAFGGTMHAVRAALEHGVKVTGCTVHLVTDEPDAGPILAQQCVDIHPDDTEASLHERIKATERQVLPRVIQAYAEGRVRIAGRHATIEPASPTPART